MESVPTSTSSASSVTSSDGRNGASGGGSEFLNLGMFGQSSGATDLLLGTGGFGGGLGNGYGNDANLVGSANAQTSAAFDLNDFPSLGGGAGTVGSGGSSNGLAAALRQQQQLLAHQQMLKSASGGNQASNLYRLAMSSGANAGQNFNMTTEDFPALPGAPPAGSGNANASVGGELGNSPLASSGNASFGVSSMSRQSSGGSGLYGIDLDGGSNPLESGGSSGSGLLGGLMGGIGGLSTGSNPSSTLGHQRSPTPSSTGRRKRRRIVRSYWRWINTERRLWITWFTWGYSHD